MSFFRTASQKLCQRFTDVNTRHPHWVNRVGTLLIGYATFRLAETVFSPFFSGALGIGATFTSYNLFSNLRCDIRPSTKQTLINYAVFSAVGCGIVGAFWAGLNDGPSSDTIAQAFKDSKPGQTATLYGHSYTHTGYKKIYVGALGKNNTIEIDADDNGALTPSHKKIIVGPRLADQFFLKGVRVKNENETFYGPTQPGWPAPAP